jgi:hypothetical protein
MDEMGFVSCRQKPAFLYFSLFSTAFFVLSLFLPSFMCLITTKVWNGAWSWSCTARASRCPTRSPQGSPKSVRHLKGLSLAEERDQCTRGGRCMSNDWNRLYSCSDSFAVLEASESGKIYGEAKSYLMLLDTLSQFVTCCLLIADFIGE